MPTLPALPTMPQSPDWKQLIETGMNFTELRRSQARQIVGDLVAQGHLAQDRAAAAVDEILELSRRRREDLRSFVQAEVQRQVSALGIATRDDLDQLERKLAAKPAVAKKVPAKKTTAAKPAAAPAGGPTPSAGA